MNLFNKNTRPDFDTVATIGFFDGVHRGHRFLLDELKRLGCNENLRTLVVTFENSPFAFFHPDRKSMQLSTISEKLASFEMLDIDATLLLRFDADLARMTSAEFMQFLYDRYRVRQLMVGYDHQFGSDRTSRLEHYQEVGAKIGIGVTICEENKELQVSSSLVRQRIGDGDIEAANRMLGYDYCVTGVVVHGQQLGRTLGFPTANLQPDADKLIPAIGVYAANALVGGKTYRAMVGIGNRPTIGGKDISIEAHLLDFAGDLYGSTIGLEFTKWLRNDVKFDSLDELKQQLQRDYEAVKNI